MSKVRIQSFNDFSLSTHSAVEEMAALRPETDSPAGALFLGSDNAASARFESPRDAIQSSNASDVSFIAG